MTRPLRAFVTGISGQDGRYLAERLLGEGAVVHALAHALEPLPDLPGVELHRGDLTDVEAVRALLVDVAPDEVYNLAALSSVARSWDEPDQTARVNGLAADHRIYHRDALYPEHLRKPRVGVDIDLGEHPGPVALDRQLLQQRRELLARFAPGGPEVDHHGCGQ